MFGHCKSSLRSDGSLNDSFKSFNTSEEFVASLNGRSSSSHNMNKSNNDNKKTVSFNMALFKLGCDDPSESIGPLQDDNIEYSANRMIGLRLLQKV